jgi:hypothetical protein
LVAKEPRLQDGNGAIALALTNLITESVTREINEISAQHSTLAQRSDTSPRLTLLTSFFYKEDHSHWAELAGALHVNLHNPFFAEVHVLMESPSGSECDQIQDHISEVLNGARLSADARERLICVPVSDQPTYGGFFDYANSKLAGKLVVLANTDVQFDETLGLIDAEALSSGDVGFVLSVQPPPYSGDYAQLFGTECDSETRCTSGQFDGWPYGGESWDAYVFHSPLKGLSSEHLSHYMNTLGGENLAAYQVEKAAGVSLSNPCKHIHAFHWHCSEKMHAVGERVDRNSGEHAVQGIMPCWDCPGMHLPEGKAALKDLCAKGSRKALQSTSLKISVKMPSCTYACLSSRDATPTSLCERSEDVDCIISECGTAPHQYYVR